MTDERRIELADRMLREVAPPVDPPPALRDRARAAALDANVGDVVRALPRRRAGILAGVAAAATAAAAAIAVTFGGGDGGRDGWTIDLTGAGDAWGRVEVGGAEGTYRTLSLRVDGLEPANGQRWYEMWYTTDTGGQMPVVSFQVPESGSTVVEATVPSGVRWKRCWVALKSGRGQESPSAVLTSD